MRKPKEYRIYKPKKTNDGAASKLQIKTATKEKTNKDKIFKIRTINIFWVAAQQTGIDDNNNALFGWTDSDKSVTIKLGDPDIGEILAVLNNKKNVTGNNGKFKGLFHQNDKGNASFCLEKSDYGYNLRIAKKIGNNQPIQVMHTISVAEGEILKILLEEAIKTTYLW